MSQGETTYVVQALVADGQGVRVEFQKSGDRFSHVIFLVTPSGTLPILESIEGTSDEMAPASPPFAEIHQQGELIFLSGATTLGHWSMSVQPSEGRLQFDVACRIKSPAEKLGSCYRVLAQGTAVDAVKHVDTIGATPRVEGELLSISPDLASADSVTNAGVASGYPATVQWRYTVGM